LLFGKNTPKIFDQAKKFLDKKGMIEHMENHSVIRIFCSQENPSFLPYNVSEKIVYYKSGEEIQLMATFFP
jgi:hypothetical protein